MNKIIQLLYILYIKYIGKYIYISNMTIRFMTIIINLLRNTYPLFGCTTIALGLFMFFNSTLLLVTLRVLNTFNVPFLLSI